MVWGLYAIILELRINAKKKKISQGNIEKDEMGGVIVIFVDKIYYKTIVITTMWY